MGIQTKCYFLLAELLRPLLLEKIRPPTPSRITSVAVLFPNKVIIIMQMILIDFNQFKLPRSKKGISTDNFHI